MTLLPGAGPASNKAATYFIPPNFSKHLAPGPICLGQLIHKITEPSQTIDDLPAIDLSSYNINVETIASDAIAHATSSLTSMNTSLFHKAVQVIGASRGAKMEKLSYQNVIADIAEFKLITIDPTADYIQASLQQQPIQSWVKKTYFSKGVYMVTGILIATPRGDTDGSNVSTTSEGDSSDEASIDGAPLINRNTRETVSKIIPATSFVYGFRLRQCFFRRGRAGSVVHARDAKEHATEASKVLPVKERSVFSYSGIAEFDLNIDQLGSVAEGLFEAAVWDDASGDDCTVVLATWKSQE